MTRAKIYTKTGDRGTTSLVGGARVSKSDVRLEAYGTLDELNSWLGLLRSSLDHGGGDSDAIDVRVRAVQHALFNIGSRFACEVDSVRPRLPNVGPDDVADLERDVDQWDQTLAPLSTFILPGGTRAASVAHLARTVCRRAERGARRMSEAGHPVEDDQLTYLNRLSDWLFVLARVVNARAGTADVAWEKS